MLCTLVVSTNRHTKTGEGKLTGRLNETRVVFPGEKRVRKVPEELLQQTGNTIDVVAEILGVSEV